MTTPDPRAAMQMAPEDCPHCGEVVEKAREVIGWFPGPAAWHTTAPTDAADALRSALADLEGAGK